MAGAELVELRRYQDTFETRLALGELERATAEISRNGLAVVFWARFKESGAMRVAADVTATDSNFNATKIDITLDKGYEPCWHSSYPRRLSNPALSLCLQIYS